MRPAIVKSKKWNDEDELYKPSRVVLLKWFTDDGEFREYSTHIQCHNKKLEKDGKLELYHGHYYQEYYLANRDFLKREA